MELAQEGGMGQGQGQAEERMLLDKIKEALVNGATPEELLQAGVPEQLLQMAIQELQNEMAQQDPMQPGQGAGSPMGPPRRGLAAAGMQ